VVENHRVDRSQEEDIRQRLALGEVQNLAVVHSLVERNLEGVRRNLQPMEVVLEAGQMVEEEEDSMLAEAALDFVEEVCLRIRLAEQILGEHSTDLVLVVHQHP